MLPLISVVVPVFRVPTYLPQCLDSILDQSFDDIELIAVDDYSPDECGEILESYAMRDPRVRVMHLARNVGLGPARCAGFDMATGEYVWFVDSDDYLIDGALAAVAKRVAELGSDLGPDMLLVDYHRESWTRPDSRSNLPEVLPVESTPDVFTAAEQPGVFATFHTAWARVLRRDLVARAGFPFHPGWYEDVSFTYPLLVAARRISVLRRVCYDYRDIRDGAITRTNDSRHFDVFEQYERLFATLDRRGVETHSEIRAHVFDRMLRHYWWILNGSARVPQDLQRAFFARMSEHYERFRPTELVSPIGARHPGIENLKRGLIAHESWRTFAVLRSARRAGHTAKGRIQELVRTNVR